MLYLAQFCVLLQEFPRVVNLELLVDLLELSKFFAGLRGPFFGAFPLLRLAFYVFGALVDKEVQLCDLGFELGDTSVEVLGVEFGLVRLGFEFFDCGVLVGEHF